MGPESTKRIVAGVLVDAVTPDEARDRVIDAAESSRPYSVSALAVHGVMTGVDDPEHMYRLNHLDLVTPDGQPVRWAINWLHGEALVRRVYGPTLMLDVCQAAAERGLPIFLYGSTQEVISDLRSGLRARFPDLIIAGAEPSQFRTGTDEEAQEVATRIRNTGARICFVGLGCPRQEVFAYEMADLCQMPVVAVGAAFDFHSGHQKEPPAWVQDHGLQWLHRLAAEPRRLAHRYLVLSPRYLVAVARQQGGAQPRHSGRPPAARQNYL